MHAIVSREDQNLDLSIRIEKSMLRKYSKRNYGL